MESLQHSDHVCDPGVREPRVCIGRQWLWLTWNTTEREGDGALERAVAELLVNNKIWQSVGGPGCITICGVTWNSSRGCEWDFVVHCQRGISDVITGVDLTSSFRLGLPFALSAMETLRVVPFPCRDGSAMRESIIYKHRQYLALVDRVGAKLTVSLLESGRDN
jgi:hypothetical protein